MEIDEFENIISKAKLKALSKISLLRPLTDEEYDEMMRLGDMLEVII